MAAGCLEAVRKKEAYRPHWCAVAEWPAEASTLTTTVDLSEKDFLCEGLTIRHAFDLTE